MHESRKELHARKRALAAIKNMDFIPFNNFCAAVADVFNTSLRDTILGLPYALKNILGSNHPERELFKIVFLITGKKENEIRIEGRKFNNHVYIANIITDSIDAEKLSAYQDNGKIPLSLSLDNNGIFQVSLAD